MPTFKDVNGREWALKLDGPTLAEIRKETGVRLGVFDPQAFNDLADDYEQLVNVLWIVCRQQASHAGVDAASFGRAVYGDPIEDATLALRDTWLDFFPTRKRLLLRSLLDKQAAITTEGMTHLQTEIQAGSLTEAMQAKVKQTIQEAIAELMNPATGKPSASSSPASSESTPPA